MPNPLNRALGILLLLVSFRPALCHGAERKIAFTGSAAKFQERLRIIHQRQVDLHRRGLYIVGGWAVANIGVGLYAESQTTGQTRWFYRSMWAWNLVNLAIAGIGYWAVSDDDLKSPTLAQTAKAVSFSSNFYLKMASLDTAYVAMGFLLWEIGNGKTGVDRNKYIGFGKGFIFQGAALLVMDLINHYSQKSNGSAFYDLLGALYFEHDRVGIRLNF